MRWILLAVGTALALAGATWIAHADLDARRAAFETDARIVHRLLSQRVVQHDAILDTLAILQPGGTSETAPEQRLPAIYPQVLRVLRQDAATSGHSASGTSVRRSIRSAKLAGSAARTTV